MTTSAAKKRSDDAKTHWDGSVRDDTLGVHQRAGMHTEERTNPIFGCKNAYDGYMQYGGVLVDVND